MDGKQRVANALFGVWWNGLQLNRPQLFEKRACAIVVVEVGQGFDILYIVSWDKVEALGLPDLRVDLQPTAQEISLVTIGNPGHGSAVEWARNPRIRCHDRNLMDFESPRVKICLVPRQGIQPAVEIQAAGVGGGTARHAVEVEVYIRVKKEIYKSGERGI